MDNQRQMEEVKRKGSKSIKDIPSDILERLNCGQIETANLVEWLAIDQRLLLENLLKECYRTPYLEPILSNIEVLKKQTVNTINETIGTGLLEQSFINDDTEILSIIAAHKSDVIRCWATFTIGNNHAFDTAEKLKLIQPFSADKHFGVREVSWLAVRPTIAKNLIQSIGILSTWTHHNDENVTSERSLVCAYRRIKTKSRIGLEYFRTAEIGHIKVCSRQCRKLVERRK
jgi:hypothetical protein